jgi:hypothetical protein
VAVSRTEFAGLTFATRAFIACTDCGLEREIGGDAVRPLVEAARDLAA